MDVEQIVKTLNHWYNTDLEILFKAILNSNLPPTDYIMGEADRLNKFKDLIKKNQ